MAILKCKMCGGNLTLNKGATVVECEYCGTTQTVPSADNEKKMTLFARAERLRSSCEFDKAAGIYESIIADFPEEAEAYWGLLLCKYGIEYVDDPATGKKIPTCHRSSFDSIMDDEDFEQVMENADSIARKVYREEAKAIEEIRKGILEVSSQEEPYDIFICYKETDENGERTIDSVIAQDIYNELSNEGYRVFFARISLEDKLGTAYEPYIFAALNSAKVMLAIGTDYYYFNAVWVKNEWSRFLSLIAKGEKKTLIPCYKDIDAYDIPKEFKHLQAQDLGKVGAMQDLLRGMKKIFGNIQKQSIHENHNNNTNPSIVSYLKRVRLFLEESKWDKANEYCEKILDAEPECAEAYYLQLMAELRIKTDNDFEQSKIESGISDYDQYKNAYRFGDEKLKNLLEKLNSKTIYNSAQNMSEIAESEKAFIKAAQLFEKIPSFNDSEQKAKICRDKAEEFVHIQDQIESLIPKISRKLQKRISCGLYHTVVLKSDGTVVAIGSNDEGQCNVGSWRDIVAVACGDIHTVGLKLDGTVVATGANDDGRCNVGGWNNIIDIACGGDHTIGLKGDGTVVAIGDNRVGQCNVSSWRNIVSIAGAIGGCFSVGVKSNGIVVATGANQSGQCKVENWRDIVAVSCGSYHTIGLKKDNTVIATRFFESEYIRYNDQCFVNNWYNNAAIACGSEFTVALKENGTVDATTGFYLIKGIDAWKNMLSVACGPCHAVGIKYNGTIVAVGRNNEGQCNVNELKLFDDLSDEYNKIKSLEEKRKAELRANEVRRLKAARERKIAKRKAEITEMIKVDKNELSNLKGLFTGKRRRELENEIASLEAELNKLG